MTAAAPHPRRRLTLAATLATAAIAAATLAPPTAPPAAATNHVTALIDLRTRMSSTPYPTDVIVDDVSRRAYVSVWSSGLIAVFDLETDKIMKTIDVTTGGSSGPAALALDATHHRLYVANSNSSTVSVIDTVLDEVLTVVPRGALGVGSNPRGIAVDPEVGRAYVVNTTDGTVSVINTSDNSVKRVIPRSTTQIGDSPKDIQVDHSASRAYVANTGSGTVSVIDTHLDQVVAVLPHGAGGIGSSPRQIAVDVRRHRAFVLQSGSIAVIDTTTDTVIDTVATGVPDEQAAIGVDDSSGRIILASETAFQTFDGANYAAASSFDNAAPHFFGGIPRAIATDGLTSKAYVVAETTHSVAVVDLESVRGLVRQSGGDRFASAVRVSAAEFAPGVEAVYVASGENFPDALSGSAAAGSQGVPVLLVGRNSVPPGVGDEIRRLKPKRIVVLGGPQAVSTEVETELGGYAPIARLTGADRFAVSAAVSRTNFPVGVPVAYVASGENFPDALSGGAAAAHGDAPVLLVSKNGVPIPVATELKRLKPGKIVVLGGENAVSSDVASALRDIAPTERITGADRFVVSAAISAATFPGGAKTVFVASGAGFADALAGGPAAAANGGPVLLVRPDAVPDAIGAELQRLKPTRIVVLGGEQAVSKAVFEQLRAFVK